MRFRVAQNPQKQHIYQSRQLIDSLNISNGDNPCHAVCTLMNFRVSLRCSSGTLADPEMFPEEILALSLCAGVHRVNLRTEVRSALNLGKIQLSSEVIIPHLLATA